MILLSFKRFFSYFRETKKSDDKGGENNTSKSCKLLIMIQFHKKPYFVYKNITLKKKAEIDVILMNEMTANKGI